VFVYGVLGLSLVHVCVNAVKWWLISFSLQMFATVFFFIVRSRTQTMEFSFSF
jgi:hypothetical protein